MPPSVELSIEKAWSYITDRKRGQLYIYDNETENTLVVGWDWDGYVIAVFMKSQLLTMMSMF